ncbi:MAG: zf-TFIIB domain-containing protein [Candidatus Binatia bacterium]
MADIDKDRFGEKLREKERAQEDIYFAQKDRELLEKLRKQRRENVVQGQSESPRCPRCGTQLVERVVRDVTVDECPNCGGVWLDKGELEHLAGREQESWFGRLFGSRD